MIQLKSAREIELMAQGGKILAATVEHLRGVVRAGLSTGELDKIAEDFIRSHDGATPAFKGLYGFPGSICTSINSEVVHGIPSRKRVLKEGDVISIDVGVGYKGYFTDSAVTVPVGRIEAETQRLLDVTQEALAAIPKVHKGAEKMRRGAVRMREEPEPEPTSAVHSTCGASPIARCCMA